MNCRQWRLISQEVLPKLLGNITTLYRFGFDVAIKKIQKRTHDVAVYLSTEIEKMGMFEMVNDGSQLPIICYKLKDPNCPKIGHYTT